MIIEILILINAAILLPVIVIALANKDEKEEEGIVEGTVVRTDEMDAVKGWVVGRVDGNSESHFTQDFNNYFCGEKVSFFDYPNWNIRKSKDHLSCKECKLKLKKMTEVPDDDLRKLMQGEGRDSGY